MKKLCVVLFIIFSLSLLAVVEETASFKGFLYGNASETEYDNWQSHIVEGLATPGYNKYAPYDVQTTGFGNYVEASAFQLGQWQEIVELFVSGDLAATQELIDQYDYPYDVVIFNDTDTERVYHLLRERLNLDYNDDNNTPDYPDDDEIGSFDYGWGLYVHYPEAEQPVIITTPHPTDDFITVPIGLKAFEDFEARFMIISGTGREVLWTNVGPYNNGKSLSDPTRNLNHPFNKAYWAFCDVIREDFDQRELSVQMHSYDWGNSHWGIANTQVSAGYLKPNPGLPIRDLSSQKNDLIQNSEAVIFPANKFGIHPEVHLNDYYTVVYHEHGFVYDDGENSFDVNNHYTLSGYSANRQMQYTMLGWSDNDTYEPFFHIEFDELPNVYPQNSENYHWFYGWDPVNQVWDMDKTFDLSLEYYGYWIDKMAEILPDVFAMDDGLVPETPENFIVSVQANDYIKLTWDRLDCFDFHTFEILASTEPIENGNYQTITRNDADALACMATSSLTFNNLDPETEYYFQIRALDKNGNYSDFSPEVSGFTTQNIVSNLQAVGEDEQAVISWQGALQTGLHGYKVYREIDGEMQPVSDLIASDNVNQEEFQFVETGLENGQEYNYQLEMIDLDGSSFFFGEILSVVPAKIFKLQFELDGNYSETVYFGMNEKATDLYDVGYDVVTETEVESNYLISYFSEPSWQGNPHNAPTAFRREMHGIYDETTEARDWEIIFRTDQLEQPVTVSLLNPERDAERMYLKYGTEYYDLYAGEFQFTPGGEYNHSFQLYWGNLVPEVEISNLPREVILPNTTINFAWDIQHQNIVQQVDLLVRNDDVEISVANQISAAETNVSWLIPEFYLENLHFVVRLTMNEGDVIEVESDDVFAIRPAASFIDTYAGWNLISYPFIASELNIAEIYGENSSFYYLLEEEFLETTELNYGEGYWQFSSENFQTWQEGEYESSDYLYSLNQGWNLVPNPFIVDFAINDLRFVVNNNYYEYNEAIQYGLIQPNFYAYENKHFEPTTILQPQAANYLYSYHDDVDVMFSIYYDNDIDADLVTDWQVKLIAESATDKSSIIVGTSSVASAGYDSFYDLLKPELKPMAQQIELSLQEDFSSEKLHQSITAPLTGGDELYTWQVALTAENTEMLQFSVEPENLPEQLNLFLEIGDEVLPLHENETLQIYPENEQFEFVLRISDAASAAEDNLLPQLSLGNYPNPFNPTTTLNFSLAENEQNVQLEIYNVRGQKVKTILQKALPQGKHQAVWNGLDDQGKTVASGVYFAKLAIDKQLVRAHKMLLLK
ncbi:MAG: FlgD immunoglobulin-like domain containing protein [Candidatus Cloacimonadales bacterium]